MKKTPKDFSGCRVLITGGKHAGCEGVCLGKTEDGRKWAVSPDDSNEIAELEFEKDFGLLLDMTRDGCAN